VRDPKFKGSTTIYSDPGVSQGEEGAGEKFWKLLLHEVEPRSKKRGDRERSLSPLESVCEAGAPWLGVRRGLKDPRKDEGVLTKITDRGRNSQTYLPKSKGHRRGENRLIRELGIAGAREIPHLYKDQGGESKRREGGEIPFLLEPWHRFLRREMVKTGHTGSEEGETRKSQGYYRFERVRFIW